MCYDVGDDEDWFVCFVNVLRVLILMLFYFYGFVFNDVNYYIIIYCFEDEIFFVFKMLIVFGLIRLCWEDKWLGLWSWRKVWIWCYVCVGWKRLE